MRSQRFFAIGAVALIAGLWLQVPIAAQGVPLGLTSASGQGVTPAYEGWYANPDGTFTLSFGYFNRNTDQVLEIPLGENNSIEPAEFDGMQPTRFEARILHPRRSEDRLENRRTRRRRREWKYAAAAFFCGGRPRRCRASRHRGSRTTWQRR